MRRTGIKIFLLLCICFLLGQNSFFVKAADTQREENLKMEGGQIRIVEPMGLRMVASIQKSYLKELEQKGVVEYGIVVLPKKYLGGKELTADGEYLYNGKIYKPMIVPAKKIFHEDEKKIYFTAVLTNIVKEKYQENYEARPYVKVITETEQEEGSGETSEELTYGEESIDRQIYEIAEAAVEGNTEQESTKEWLQQNILDPVEKPEDPSEEDKEIAFQLGKVSLVTLYKKSEEGTVEELSSFDKTQFQKEEHFVKVELKDQPEVFAEITEVMERDGRISFRLKLDDFVTRNGRSTENGAIVEYGKVSGNTVTTKYTTMQALLAQMKANPSGNFVLEHDMDASQIPAADELIGDFRGTFDGQGYKITGLSSTLFGQVRGATIKNLVLENVQINKSNRGGHGLGIMADEVFNDSKIENVHVSGSLNTSGTRNRVGGIAGYFSGSTIERCSANINITSTGNCVGGLVGENVAHAKNALIKNSYAVGTIAANGEGVGGLIGWQTDVTVENSYAMVEMKSAHATNRAGGFTGVIKGTVGDQGAMRNNVSLSTGGAGYKFDGMSPSEKLIDSYENNYTLLESNLTKDSDRFGEKANGKITEKPLAELSEESFYTDMGWDKEVWDFAPLKQGKTPILKGIDPNMTSMAQAIADNEKTGQAIEENQEEIEAAQEGIEAAQEGIEVIQEESEMTSEEIEVTPEQSIASVAARSEEAREELELTALNEVDGYQQDRKQLYENLKILMPFYNEEQIIKDGNKVPVTHVLNKEKVLAVYPMDEKGAMIVGLTAENAPHVKRIRIQFANADVTPLIYNVTYIDTRSKIASYEISQYKIHYNYNKYVVDTKSEQFQTLLDTAKGYDFETDIKNRVAQWDVEAVIHSYRRNYNDTVKKEMEQVIVSFVANNPQYPIQLEHEIAKAMTKEMLFDSGYLKDFLYAYNYVDRWYDFEIGGINMRNVVMFDNSLLHSRKKSRGVVTDITKSTSNVDRQGNNTSFLYNNRIAPYMGMNSVGEFLEYFMAAYAGYEDVNNWIIDNFQGGVVVEAKSLNPKITTRMWHFIKSNTVFGSQQMVLPLLSYKTSKNLYIASFPTALIYGNLQIYPGYQNTDAWRETKRRELSNQVSQYRNIYDNFVEVASNGASSVNRSKFLIVDSSYNKDRSQDVFIEFYKPLQTIWSGNNGAVAYVFGDPNKDYIHYNSSSFIGDLTVLNHEMGHVTDAWIWMENKGKRPGRNGEDYSNGFANQANLDYNMNFMREYSRDSEMVCNLTPDRINSPEEFQSYYKEVFDAIYTLDYLQGLAYLQLSPDQQSQITAQHHYGRKGAHQIPNSANSTWDVPDTAKLESMNLKTLDDLWDHQLTIRPGQRYDISSQVDVGINNFGAYQLDRLSFASWYVPYVEGATPNAQTFRRNAFELGGLFGYSDGLVEYLSGRTRTGDLEFYKKIMKDENFSFEKYRKQKNREIEEKIKAQEAQGNPYFDTDALVEYLKQNLIHYGNGIHTGSSNFGNTLQNIKTSRENVFRYLQRITNEFRTPLYAESAEARQVVEISTAEELVQKLNEKPHGFYVLTADISLESVEAKNGVYVDKTFIGKLEGRGHKITNAKAPLFRKISNSYVSDLTIEGENGAAVNLAQLETYTIRVQEVKGEKEISTLEELKQIGKNDCSKYILTADIDASGFTGDVLISGNFSSVLEGNNHTITGLKAPLFEKIDNGTVQNLKIKDVDVKKTGEYATAIAKRTNHAVIRSVSLENVKLSGTNYVAPVSGYDYIGSEFSNIQVRNIEVKASGYYSSTFVGRAYSSYVSDIAVIDGSVQVVQTENGGFIGSGNHLTVERVYSDADITLTGYTDHRLLSAGFIGRLTGESSISYAIAAGDVICEDEGKEFYKFIGTPEVIGANIHHSYELDGTKGKSNVTEDTAAENLMVATEEQKKSADFYRTQLNLSEEIWNLTLVNLKGYPELKGMEKETDLTISTEEDMKTTNQYPDPEEEFPQVQNYPLLKESVPEGYIGIYSAEDLKKIDENPTGQYILMNNISMENISAENGTYLKTLQYPGTLDGNNQVIYGLKEGALFDNLAGNVSNLRIQNVKIDKGTEPANALAKQVGNNSIIQKLYFSHIYLTGGSNTAVVAGEGTFTTLNEIKIENMQITLTEQEDGAAEAVEGIIGTAGEEVLLSNNYVEGIVNMDGATISNILVN